MGLTPDEALDFFDKSGVVVRRSGMLDGEAIGYMAIENDPALKKKYRLRDQDGADGELARSDDRTGQGRAQSSIDHDLVDRERMAVYQLHQSLWTV